MMNHRLIRERIFFIFVFLSSIPISIGWSSPMNWSHGYRLMQFSSTNFSAVRHFGTGNDITRSLAVGDVDGDGDLDLMAGNFTTQNSVILNDGNGNFEGNERFFGPANARTNSIVLCDVDGDGDLDAALGNASLQNVVYLNDGKGNFNAGNRSFGTAIDFTFAIAFGDVDNDGDPDVVVGNGFQQNAVYLNDGRGNFTAGVRNFGSGRDYTQAIELADVDGDGSLDIVVGNSNGQPNAIYYNDGDGNFTASAQYFGTGSDDTLALASGDVDGDGDVDLVTGNQYQQNVVYLNDGRGNFTESIPFGPSGDCTYSLALGDVDGDGDLDLAVGNKGQKNYLYLNDGQGYFVPIQIFGTGNDETEAVLFVDVDGDGDLDLAVGNYTAQNVVYINEGFGDIVLPTTRPTDSPTPTFPSSPTSTPTSLIVLTATFTPVPTLTPTPSFTSTRTPSSTSPAVPTQAPTATLSPVRTLSPRETVVIDLPELPDGVRKLEMALIPAGMFIMGSPPTEQNRESDEGPQHQVSLSRDFLLGVYEITQAQWRAVMKNNPSFFHGDNRPVEQVSWLDCAAFCNALSRLTGRSPAYNENNWTVDLHANGFRLPTEAEWEYACRAGTSTRYYWGDDSSYVDIGEYAWYSGISNLESKNVGILLPNPFGLFDMSGNVREWCTDEYGVYSLAYQVDPVYQSSIAVRVARGGGWFDVPSMVRSAVRSAAWVGGISNFVGFRIATTGLQTPPPTATLTPSSTPASASPTTIPPSITPTPTVAPLPTVLIELPNLAASAKGLEMILVTAGSFIMGSAVDEQDRETDEGPQHHVTLTREFLLGKFEVTQAQWSAVMGDNPASFIANDRPVEQVSWFDCVRFCNRLSQLTGRLPAYDERDWSVDLHSDGFRLPTEAEWEYACRAGTSSRYYWWDDPVYVDINEYAWYFGNADLLTHAVGLKRPNPWGFFDMSGNVTEWCADEYTPYLAEDRIDPIWQNSLSLRVGRGGSWFDVPSRVRSAVRSSAWPGSMSPFVGFRVASSRVIPFGYTPTSTPTATSTFTATPTPTSTPTFTQRPTELPSPTNTSTPTATPTPTSTPTPLPTVRIQIPGLPAGAFPLDMVEISAGSFIMGSADDEVAHEANEGPQHAVTLTRDFLLGKYEVTQAQWAAVMGYNPSDFRGNNLPVEQVNWFDCVRFCNMLSRLTGKTPVYDEFDWTANLGADGFRLSTEAEWEYACRAGTSSRYYWSDDLLYTEMNEYAWYFGNAGLKTHAVGSLRPNFWGLFDMSGNVTEWCSDEFSNYADAPPIDPFYQGILSQRIGRGGCWFDIPSRVRSAVRSSAWPGSSSNFVGFRLAASNVPSSPITPTQIPTPVSTPISGMTLFHVFPLDAADEFVELAGGFTDAPGGTVTIGEIPASNTTYTDGNGVTIVVSPSQVQMLMFPSLEIGDHVILMRISVKADAPGASLGLAVLDGSMDGSLAMSLTMKSDRFVEDYKRMVLLYDPPGTTIVPLVQAVGSSEGENVTVYLDQLEILLIPPNEPIPSEMFYGK
ncbi:MAG: hypothetical protein C4527_11110 [Candidatus Omnitrophota bacterium]|jgi:formylglycine-generating enzyme required for sulfatase activity|nr:MAG: hypothetical protein C4527_11110 [Candidatus Omnitrophota bacterium]